VSDYHDGFMPGILLQHFAEIGEGLFLWAQGSFQLQLPSYPISLPINDAV
jgi:hypothetical protein